LIVLGVAWFAQGFFDRPEIAHEVGGAADGHRAQQKLFDLAGGIAPRRDQKRGAVTLTEPEINAFLTRHVSEDLPLADGGVRLVGNGVVEVTGRLPLHAVLGDSVSSVARLLPGRWAGQPVWLRIRGHVRLETGAARGDVRRLRIDPDAVWFGTRRVPAAALTVLPDGRALRATRWPVPEAVDTVVVEPGRLTIVRRP
jgi:hypothetical protein